MSLQEFYQNRRITITAGPTREWIDPIRFISNAATGALGFALARVARSLGATVQLVSGPTTLPPPPGITVTPVESAHDMWRACQRLCKTAQIVIMTAAVADVRPAATAPQKLKKSARGGFPLRAIPLEPTPDILQALCDRRRAGQYLVGCCLETENMLANARAKLQRKGCQMIIANGREAIGAAVQRATVLTHTGGLLILPPLSKIQLARRLLARIAHEAQQAR